MADIIAAPEASRASSSRTRKQPRQVSTGPARTARADDAPEDALAALEAHFLAAFEQPAASQVEGRPSASRAKGKGRAKDAVAADLPAVDEPPPDKLEAVLGGLRGRKTKTDRIDPSQAANSSSSSATLPLRRVPETIVFGGESAVLPADGSSSSSSKPLDSRKKWRDFMKTQTPNTKPDSMTSASETLRAKVAERRAREAEAKAKKRQQNGQGEGDEGGDEGDEAEQITNDRQLSHLLNTTLFASGGDGSRKGGGSSDKPDLSSHATLARLLDLSSSSAARKGQTFGRGHGDKSLRASQLAQMPAQMRQGIRAAAGHRADLEVARREEMGLLGDARSRKLLGRQEADATMTGKAKAKRDRTRGLGLGVGKFQGGMLKLSQKEVNDMVGGDRDRGAGAGAGARGRKRSGPGGHRDGGGGGGGGDKGKKRRSN
ncbi:unnamed protein product [Parajaminaea phylloscopi]